MPRPRVQEIKEVFDEPEPPPKPPAVITGRAADVVVVISRRLDEARVRAGGVRKAYHDRMRKSFKAATETEKGLAETASDQTNGDDDGDQLLDVQTQDIQASIVRNEHKRH